MYSGVHLVCSLQMSMNVRAKVDNPSNKSHIRPYLPNWVGLGLFSHESKGAQFKLSFELRNLNDHSNDGILDRVVRKITLRCIIWNAQFKLWSGPSFELRISSNSSRCNFAYTRSKIPSFEWSFQLRNSNYASRCNIAYTWSKIPSFEWSFKLRISN